MKQSFSKNGLSQIAVGAILTVLGSSSFACGKNDILCKVNKGLHEADKILVEPIKQKIVDPVGGIISELPKTVQTFDNKVLDGFDSAGNVIKNGVDKGGNIFLAGLNSTEKTTYAGLQKTARDAESAAKAANDRIAALEKQGENISTSQMKNLVNASKGIYLAANRSLQDAYKSVLNAYQSLLDKAIQAYFRDLAMKYIDKNKDQYIDMRRRALNLDAAAKAAFNRVQNAALTKSLTKQTGEDMQVLLKAIVYGGKDVGNAIEKSSFGIQVCNSGGFVVAGVESCYLVLTQTYKEPNGEYKVGIATSVGGSALVDLGADQSVGIFWGPGGVDDADGTSIGFVTGAALEEGMSLGFSWALPKGVKDLMQAGNYVPSISLGLSTGGKVEAAATLGQTKLVSTYRHK